MLESRIIATINEKASILFVYSNIFQDWSPCIDLTNGTPGVNKFKKLGNTALDDKHLKRIVRKRKSDKDRKNTQPKVSQYQPYFHH